MFRSRFTRSATRPTRTARPAATVPAVAGTVAFGDVAADPDDSYDDGGVALGPEFLPGLEPDEQLENRTTWRRARRSSPATVRCRPKVPPKLGQHLIGQRAIDVTGQVGQAEEEDLVRLPAGLLAGHPGRRQRPRAGLQRALCRPAWRGRRQRLKTAPACCTSQA